MNGCEPPIIVIADQGIHKSRRDWPNHVRTCTVPIIRGIFPLYTVQLQLIARDDSMGDCWLFGKH